MFADSLVALVGILALQTSDGASSPTQILNQLPVAKYVEPAIPGPVKKKPERVGMEITARAGVVMDVGSGEILFSKNAHGAYPIASLTKLMTAMVLLDQDIDLDTQVTVSAEDLKGEGKAVFAPNEKFTRRELLQAMLVGSVNAAGNTIARTTGDHDTFIRAMNEKARALGLEEATFFDPTGLDARNQASAKDVALILRTALSYPDIRKTTELQKIDLKSRIGNKPYLIKSTNLLLDSFLNKGAYRIIAAKTGSLPEAGFCLAQATNQNGHEVIVVVLGSENHFERFQDAKALTFWAFDTYSWPQVSTLPMQIGMR